MWSALGCLAVAGAADTISVISRGALVQLATPDGARGRVSAAFQTSDAVAAAGGALAAPAVVALVGLVGLVTARRDAMR